LSGDHLFSLETEALSENQTVPAYTDTFPFQEFTGLIIYITALLGLLNYMKDNQNNVYGRLSKRKRLSFCIMNIMADITPAAILGFVALAVYNKGASLFLMMLQMIFYIFICLILCIIFRFIFRSYKIYCGVLPLLIVCALLLSGIKILSLYIY
jgi:uncharacterized membrane protein